ncbi:fungal protease inhibitor-1-like [Hyposmocoma kahamanoa]|uniref:fungal protease inhibitor-1-like n=1 Tax=Hyposmocoma kahamanoa TaxID=1477025 RepID=UPI000E6DA2E4|nr:fungal protease inhibitor-1-like [Hyposmocoma kahamanoa]
MKGVLILVLLACAMAFTYGDLICGSNYCKQHPCSNPVTASSCQKPSEYRTNHSGQCACCPACVTLLSEGAACKAYSKELGETPSAVCKEPLKCLASVCTKASTRV